MLGKNSAVLVGYASFRDDGDDDDEQQQTIIIINTNSSQHSLIAGYVPVTVLSTSHVLVYLMLVITLGLIIISSFQMQSSRQRSEVTCPRLFNSVIY